MQKETPVDTFAELYHLQGMEEDLARFYIASIVLALEYLHDSSIVYRDLKPENVFIDSNGYIKLGDFGFAKVLNDSNRTFTFCGTPGYVAPENVLAHGYNYSVDWCVACPVTKPFLISFDETQIQFAGYSFDFIFFCHSLICLNRPRGEII